MLWMIWNLFLAVVPVALALLIACAARAGRANGSLPLRLLLVPLGLLWLAFLPNSCYLFTEVRHFLAAVDRENLWYRSAAWDSRALAELVQRGTVAAIYLAAGALTYGLAIRPVRQVIEESGVAAGRLRFLFFFLMGLGVYLGLRIRFNSWDLFVRTSEVMETTVALASRPTLLLLIGGLGLALWAAYEVVDIWLDGLALRWERMRGSAGQGATAPVPSSS